MARLTLAAFEPGVRAATHAPRPDVSGVPLRAAVAVVLRERAGDVDLLVVRRAERAGDRWSGDAALPGGHVDPDDASPAATARREALEEVGLDLGAPARVLGVMRPHPGPTLRRFTGVSVTPVVFSVVGDPHLVPDRREIAAATWVPLSALRSRAHRGRVFHYLKPAPGLPLGLPMLLPCWRYRDLVIWGITHAIVDELLSFAR
jgi:8-oxo-dGTP pyrophosphatase MutT (NUDIX family)